MREPAAIAQQRDARGATWVPVVEAEQVVDSLKKRGIPVEYSFPTRAIAHSEKPYQVNFSQTKEN